MIFAFQKNEILLRKKLNRKTTLLFILFASFLLIFSTILVINNNPSFSIAVVNYSNSNPQNNLNYGSISTITQNSNLLIPSISFIIIIFISLLLLGVFTVQQPRALREIVTSNTLKIIFSKESESTDIGIIK